MATRGTYGIVHEGNTLITSQFFDMFLNGHGFDLAREAFAYHDLATDSGSV